MTMVQMNFRKPCSIWKGIQVGHDRNRGNPHRPANATIRLARRPRCVENDRIKAHPTRVQPANPTQCASSLGPKPQAGFEPTKYIVAKGRVTAISKPRAIRITPKHPTANIFPEFICSNSPCAVHVRGSCLSGGIKFLTKDSDSLEFAQ